MINRVFLLMLAVVFLTLPANVNAMLFNRGGGLIYDDVLDVTWLQDANYHKTSGLYGKDVWSGAVNWVENLSYYDSVRKVTWTDWRLPKVLPVNGVSYNYVFSFDGSSDLAHNISAPGSMYPGSISSELAYMYYVNLGNLSVWNVDGTPYQPGWGLESIHPFINLQPGNYWTGTTVETLPREAIYFNFYDGNQSKLPKEEYALFIWAVRDGDVHRVLEPATMLLLGLGLVGLAGMRNRLRD